MSLHKQASGFTTQPSNGEKSNVSALAIESVSMEYDPCWVSSGPWGIFVCHFLD